MKERGILFSAPMVRAILAGQKTQTRRVMKLQSFLLDGGGHPFTQSWDSEEQVNWRRDVPCPYGQPGDRLWVRETWAPLEGDDLNSRMAPPGEVAMYRADHSYFAEPTRWRPSIFMPRRASRITLEVTGVRVERLQDIKHFDVLKEGIAESHPKEVGLGAWMAGRPERETFVDLWESINGAGSWTSNPWVWVIEFKRVEAKSEAA